MLNIVVIYVINLVLKYNQQYEQESFYNLMPNPVNTTEQNPYDFEINNFLYIDPITSVTKN